MKRTHKKLITAAAIVAVTLLAFALFACNAKPSYAPNLPDYAYDDPSGATNQGDQLEYSLSNVTSNDRMVLFAYTGVIAVDKISTGKLALLAAWA
ncbi:MAG: hypothetical protein LBM78_03955, partial [Clostridiales bacterium]|nr:hypothetical protein [Clostridiales bacterium]